MASTCRPDVVGCGSTYRALVLQAHHEGAHVPRGLVVDDDHGLLLGDGPHVVAPLRHCGTNGQEKNFVTTSLLVTPVSEATPPLRCTVHRITTSPQGKTKPLLELFIESLNEMHNVFSTSTCLSI